MASVITRYQPHPILRASKRDVKESALLGELIPIAIRKQQLQYRIVDDHIGKAVSVVNEADYNDIVGL
jgi:hypothetical protein